MLFFINHLNTSIERGREKGKEVADMTEKGAGFFMRDIADMRERYLLLAGVESFFQRREMEEFGATKLGFIPRPCFSDVLRFTLFFFFFWLGGGEALPPCIANGNKR